MAPPIRPAPFQAHWDPSFGHYSPTEVSKVKRIAWDIFSILIPVIALVRFAAYKINQRIVKMALLPAANQTPGQIGESRESFFRFWLEGPGQQLPFSMEPQTVTTPDGARLSAALFRHRNGDANTPTVVYFNPNGAIFYQEPFMSLLGASLTRGAVCNFAVFDYRGTGDSRGECRSFDDLVVDGASIVQWVRERVGTRRARIHFYGWSMGGAVAAHVKALNPQMTAGRFANERSFSSTDDMIDAHLSRAMPLRLCNGMVAWNALSFLKRVSRWLGQQIDVVPAIEKMGGRKLVIYHRADPVIPYSASLERRIGAIPHEAIRLSAPREEGINHHIVPLEYYRDEATGRPAIEKIGAFFFPR